MSDPLSKKVIELKDKKEVINEIIKYISVSDIHNKITKLEKLTEELDILGNEIWEVHQPKSVYDIDKSYLDIYNLLLIEVINLEKQINIFHLQLQKFVEPLGKKLDSTDFSKYIFDDQSFQIYSFTEMKSCFEKELIDYEKKYNIAVDEFNKFKCQTIDNYLEILTKN